MTPESLLSLTGDVMIAVKAKDKYNVLDLIRLKRIITGELAYHEDYDFNKDGLIDETDVTLLKEILLNKK